MVSWKFKDGNDRKNDSNGYEVISRTMEIFIMEYTHMYIYI
jgi:hypothetical protein